MVFLSRCASAIIEECIGVDKIVFIEATFHIVTAHKYQGLLQGITKFCTGVEVGEAVTLRSLIARKVELHRRFCITAHYRSITTY